jgi:hypothetical protein
MALSIGFCAPTTFKYDNYKGYINLTNGNPAISIPIILNCSIPSTGLFEMFQNKTDNNGFYSFEGLNSTFEFIGTDSLECDIIPEIEGVTQSSYIYQGKDVILEGINPGDTLTLFVSSLINLTYNNAGNAFFDFSGINGKILSNDLEGVKNQSIMIVCNESFNYTTISDDSGNYDFSGITLFYYECDESETFGCYHNVSLYREGIFQKNFTINSQGFSGSTEPIGETIDMDYPLNVKVNGNFIPASGDYGNLTSFTYDASNYNYDINYCNYSINGGDILPFNATVVKNFTANILFPVSGQYNISVLCNTSLTTELIPKNATYDIHLEGANITINAPQIFNESIKETVFSKKSIFNITLDIPAINCYFKLNNASTQYNMSNNLNYSSNNKTYYNYIYNATPTLLEGNNSAIVYCTDIFGIQSNTSINFTADITPPSKVNSFSARISSIGRVFLIWEFVNDSYYYNIYRGKSSSNAIIDEVKIGNVTSLQTSYEDSTAKVGETYRYYIMAVDFYGNEGEKLGSNLITVINDEDYRDTIDRLQDENTELKDESTKKETELTQKGALLARLFEIENDLKLMEELLPLMPDYYLERINNINSIMQDYESKTLDELKTLNSSISYYLFGGYAKSLVQKANNSQIKSLNISSEIQESIIEINGEKYYKYDVIVSLLPSGEYLLKDVKVLIEMPINASFQGTKLENIEKEIALLETGMTQEINYSFISLSQYEPKISATMIEKSLPKPLTGYSVMNISGNSIINDIIIWAGVLILSVSLLWKYKNPHINF